MQGQLDFKRDAQQAKEPQWELQLSALLHYATEHRYDTAAKLLRGLRRGELIVAPNAQLYRVDL